MADRIMTVIFYAVAVFFLILLAAFACKVIIEDFWAPNRRCFGLTGRGALEISCSIPCIWCFLR